MRVNDIQWLSVIGDISIGKRENYNVARLNKYAKLGNISIYDKAYMVQ